MNVPYSPVTQRCVEANQSVADWLGRLLGIEDPVIWYYRPNWALGLIRPNDVPPTATALYAFETPDPDCSVGLKITDRDWDNLVNAFIRKPDWGRGDRSSDARRAHWEEIAAEGRECRDMERFRREGRRFL